MTKFRLLAAATLAALTVPTLAFAAHAAHCCGNLACCLRHLGCC